MWKIEMSICALLFVYSCNASASDSYNGFWWNEDGTAIIELVQTSNTLEGFTRWGKGEKKDVNNPDPKLKDRDLLGVMFLWGFEYKEKNNTWHNGQVYDPDIGKTYSAKIKLDDAGDILEMRGYIGVSLFGRTAIFTRVTAKEFPPTLIKEKVHS